MKKILFILLALIFIPLSLIACSYDFENKINNAYIKIGNTWVNYKIKGYHFKTENYIYIILDNDEKIIVSTDNCILYTEGFELCSNKHNNEIQPYCQEEYEKTNC